MGDRVKLSRFHWISVIVLGLCYTTFGNLQYLVQQYYTMYKDASSLSDGQMGTILTAIGICAMVAYVYNGFITDIIDPKYLMMFVMALGVVGGVVLLINPNYVVSIVVFCGFALLPLWGPAAKIVAGISSEEQVNKMFGWFDFFVAAFSLIAGFIAAGIVSASGSAAAVRALIIFYTVCNAIGVVGCWYIGGKMDKTKEGGAEDPNDKFSFKKVLILIQDPNQWMLWLGVALGYTGYIALTYVSPMLTDVFGMPVSAVTMVDALKGNAIGLIAPLVAGTLATKFGAVRSYFVWLAFYAVSVIAMIITPWAPAFMAVAVLCIVLLAFSVKGRSAISSSVITNAKTPMALFGTSVCIQSVFMTLPDTFCYNIAGDLLDKYGNTGYYYIFGMCLAFAVAGLVCNIILDRRLKAGKTSEWFFAQKESKN